MNLNSTKLSASSISIGPLEPNPGKIPKYRVSQKKNILWDLAQTRYFLLSLWHKILHKMNTFLSMSKNVKSICEKIYTVKLGEYMMKYEDIKI